MFPLNGFEKLTDQEKVSAFTLLDIAEIKNQFLRQNVLPLHIS